MSVPSVGAAGGAPAPAARPRVSAVPRRPPGGAARGEARRARHRRAPGAAAPRGAPRAQPGPWRPGAARGPAASVQHGWSSSAPSAVCQGRLALAGHAASRHRSVTGAKERPAAGVRLVYNVIKMPGEAGSCLLCDGETCRQVGLCLVCFGLEKTGRFFIRTKEKSTRSDTS